MIELSEAAKIVQGELHGESQLFSAVKSDSREIGPGDLFVAIPGENFDGHQYVSAALKCGAAGAMVSSLSDSGISQIEVDNTTLALARLATEWRTRFGCPVVAITGSNGKTTVTSMVASILNQTGKCLSPVKSFNNQWGVPLTLLRMRAEHSHAAIEMGTNHVGEIDYLCSIAKPDIAMINNVSAAHSEGLGSVDRIARAKAEIFNGLKDGGTAILNIDDEFYWYWQDYVYNRVERPDLVSFGESESADIIVRNIQADWRYCQFDLLLNGEVVQVCLPLAGRHNARNAAAAAAVALTLGLSAADIQKGLEAVEAVPGRLNIRQGINHAVVIDDSYNANPASIRAAINMLSEFKGERLLVLGVMAELGDDAEQLHEAVGEYARDHGVNALFSLCSGATGLANAYARGFGSGARIFESADALSEHLNTVQKSQLAILVKGSRSSQMEKVVEKIAITSVQADWEERN